MPAAEAAPDLMLFGDVSAAENRRALPAILR
jgi:hypothetical protein